MVEFTTPKSVWLNPSNRWYKIAKTLRYYIGMIGDWRYGSFKPEEVRSLADAEAVSSQVWGTDKHKIAIDIDMPAALVPSSTEGHFHLYIDKEIAWAEYKEVLIVLCEAGILSEKYVRESINRGYTSLRTPWTHKSSNDPDSDDS